MRKKMKLLPVLLAGMMVLQTPMVSFADAWEREHGVYVNASGAAIEGVTARGITVSKYQGNMDWRKVKSDDISFAMVRLGYLNSDDPMFDQNMRQAEANGVDTGIFVYSQALDVETAREEGRYAVRKALNYKVNYPIAMDLESKVILDAGLTRQQITDIANAFCEEVRDAGYLPMIYVNHEWFTYHIDPAQIPYDIWYGRYKDMVKTELPERAVIWQSTQEGKVDGIQGNICLEFSFSDYKSRIPADTWHKVDNQWYYFRNYVKQTGWTNVDGRWYYLNPMNQGAMAANTTMQIGGVSCAFAADGSWIPEEEGSNPPGAATSPSQIVVDTPQADGPGSAAV